MVWFACTLWHSSDEAGKVRPAECLSQRGQMQTEFEMPDCFPSAADALIISAYVLAAYPKHSRHYSEGAVCITICA